MPKMLTKDTWTKVAFGDVIRQVKDKVDPDEAGLERYIAGGHMDTDDLKIHRWGIIGDDYLGPAFHMRFKPGQVLYGSRRTYLRKVALADFEGITANTTYVLETKDPEVLLPQLLPYIMQTESFHAHSIKQSKGGVNPYINFSDIVWYEFALPPLEEQRWIAEVLQAVESSINKINDLRQKRFILWRTISSLEFGSRANTGTPLSNHYSLANGQVDPKLVEYADLPLIAPNHIESRTGNIIDIVSAREQGAISGKYYYEAGMVLYSKIRPELRKAAIAPVQGLCSADMYPLTPRASLRNKYLLEILLSASFSQFAVSGSMRTGMPKVNRKHLTKFKFDLPSITKQDQYLQLSGCLRKTDTELKSRRDSLLTLKATLLATVGLE